MATITIAADFVKATAHELGLAKHNVIIIPAQDGMVNAYVNPTTNMVLITQSLLDLLDDNELCAVMAHELAHSYHRHQQARIGMKAGRMVLSGINIFLPLPIWKKLVIELGLTVFGTVAEMKLNHYQEYEADAMSFRYGLNQALATALLKIDEVNVITQKKLGTSKLMLAFGRLTHPATEDRLKKLKANVINGK